MFWSPRLDYYLSIVLGTVHAQNRILSLSQTNLNRQARQRVVERNSCYPHFLRQELKHKGSRTRSTMGPRLNSHYA